MADKPISELSAATQVTPADLFVLEQNGEAKKLTGQTLENWLLELANSHGGIQGINKISTSGLADTYRIVFADATTSDFVITNGRGITGIAKTSTEGLVDTYTVSYNDGTSDTITVTNGAKGEPGASEHIWIKYASQMPTEGSHSFGDIPDAWIGIYTGFASTAPTDWKAYAWYKHKGEPGESIKGDPGETPQLRIGTVDTVPFDEPANATISGTKENPVISFMIPEGKPGADGENSANWSVNNPDDPGHVFNRTHYVKSDEGYVTAASVEFGASPLSSFDSDVVRTPKYNVDYRVVFEGKDYICKSRDFYGVRNVHTVAIGNCGIIDDTYDDTGEPFLIELIPSSNYGNIACPGYANKTVKFTVYEAEVVQKLDNKFLEAVWTATKRYRGVDGLLLDNREITFTTSSVVYNGLPNYWLAEGGKYTVTWNGTKYECVCFSNDGTLHLGNGALASVSGGEDVPFCFVSYGGAAAFLYKNTNTAETVNVSIVGHREILLEKLPEEYLPESVERIVLRSPDGKKFKLTVDNSGVISTTVVT